MRLKGISLAATDYADWSHRAESSSVTIVCPRSIYVAKPAAKSDLVGDKARALSGI